MSTGKLRNLSDAQAGRVYICFLNKILEIREPLSAAIAEAEIQKALGYELCKCQWPPVAMLTIGYFHRIHGKHQEGDPVFECPKCGYTDAGPSNFTRLPTNSETR